MRRHFRDHPLDGGVDGHIKDATIANFLTAVSVARCKDTAIANFAIAVSVARCKDATIANFVLAVALARCVGFVLCGR